MGSKKWDRKVRDMKQESNSSEGTIWGRKDLEETTERKKERSRELGEQIVTDCKDQHHSLQKQTRESPAFQGQGKRNDKISLDSTLFS